MSRVRAVPRCSFPICTSTASGPTSRLNSWSSWSARRGAQALYILGDLFEAWIGDDDPDPDKRRVIRACASLTKAACRFLPSTAIVTS